LKVSQNRFDRNIKKTQQKTFQHSTPILTFKVLSK
jgi:hypothetical protein